MNGFDGEKIPGWLLEAFDERTTLPHGPLDRFPVPLEGQIVGGKALVPKCGSPARYLVSITCGEIPEEAVRFLSEYLPLSGYVVFGHGTLPAKRRLLKLAKSHRAEIFLIRRPPFVGTVVVESKDNGGASIEVDIAHPHHPDHNTFIDFANPRSHPEINWKSLEN